MASSLTFKRRRSFIFLMRWTNRKGYLSTVRPFCKLAEYNEIIFCRVCWQCNMKFVKADGCNKMTCGRCGALMCYICKKPVKDYTHFNGQGGDKYHLCPLYSDTLKMHETDILRTAEEAKRELGVNQQLKHDPTADIKHHYNYQRSKNPQTVQILPLPR